MSETERKAKGLSKQATGKLQVTTGRVRMWRGTECDRPDQPMDQSVTPDQPSDLSVCGQQPDAPHAPPPRVNWT